MRPTARAAVACVNGGQRAEVEETFGARRSNRSCSDWRRVLQSSRSPGSVTGSSRGSSWTGASRMRARALGVEATYTQIPGALHGVALRALGRTHCRERAAGRRSWRASWSGFRRRRCEPAGAHRRPVHPDFAQSERLGRQQERWSVKAASASAAVWSYVRTRSCDESNDPPVYIRK